MCGVKFITQFNSVIYLLDMIEERLAFLFLLDRMRWTLKLNSCWHLANRPAVCKERNKMAIKRTERKGRRGFVVAASTSII